MCAGISRVIVIITFVHHIAVLPVEEREVVANRLALAADIEAEGNPSSDGTWARPTHLEEVHQDNQPWEEAAVETGAVPAVEESRGEAHEGL